MTWTLSKTNCTDPSTFFSPSLLAKSFAFVRVLLSCDLGTFSHQRCIFVFVLLPWLSMSFCFCLQCSLLFRWYSSSVLELDQICFVQEDVLDIYLILYLYLRPTCSQICKRVTHPSHFFFLYTFVHPFPYTYVSARFFSFWLTKP